MSPVRQGRRVCGGRGGAEKEARRDACLCAQNRICRGGWLVVTLSAPSYWFRMFVIAQNRCPLKGGPAKRTKYSFVVQVLLMYLLCAVRCALRGRSVSQAQNKQTR